MTESERTDKDLLWDKDDIYIGDEESDEIPEAEEYHPRIEPGKYTAKIFRANTQDNYKGGRKIYFRFRIIGGQCDGVELFMACNHPKGRMSPRYKYYKQWSLANNGPPARGQKLRRKVFFGKKFRVLVVDVKPKNENEVMPDHMKYSVVKTILELLDED